MNLARPKPLQVRLKIKYINHFSSDSNLPGSKFVPQIFITKMALILHIIISQKVYLLSRYQYIHSILKYKNYFEMLTRQSCNQSKKETYTGINFIYRESLNSAILLLNIALLSHEKKRIFQELQQKLKGYT